MKNLCVATSVVFSLLCAPASGKAGALEDLLTIVGGPGAAALPAIGRALLIDRAEDGPAQSEGEGPIAALNFERSTRGPKGTSGRYSYPEARPVSFAETAHIVPMSESLWTMKQVVDDFNKNRTPEQVAAIIVVKTEFCCTNRFRGCAVVTAAMEKYATPKLKKFRIYGAWIKNPKAYPAGADSEAIAAKEAWDADVEAEYGFEQGPGATIVFLDPATGTALRTDAVKMELYMDKFEERQGQTPMLDAAIDKALETFGGRTAPPAYDPQTSLERLSRR